MLDDTRRGWKKEAKAKCHEIVERTANGQMVSDKDEAFLRSLLDRHPCAADKIGAGVAGLTVEAIGMGTRWFMLHRFNGTRTDFSYYKCITSPSEVGLARMAVRRAVAEQVIVFKQASAARGALVCAVTGEILDWDGAHVDHAPPTFVALADLWAEHAGGYNTIQLLPTADGELGRRMADPVPWAAFHRDRAKLRIVSRLTNLSLLQTGRRSARPSA